MSIQHPYYPPELIFPNYVPNTFTAPTLVGIIGTSFVLVVLSSYLIFRNYWPHVSSGERWTAIWFVVCGVLHLGFEGTFVIRFRDLATRNDILSQLWKEYSLGDSRYLIQDPHVLCLETLSVIFWGPLSLLAAKYILDRDPRRFVAQTIVCTGHLYGVAIYYSTSLVEMWMHGREFSRPEVLYFWIYFIGFNAPWAVIPAVIIRNCFVDGWRISNQVEKKSL